MTMENVNHVPGGQPELDADFGTITCRTCKRLDRIDDCITVCKGGVVVFAVCSRCASWFEIALRPTDTGVDVRAMLARARL